ncbi:MAG: RNA-binding transcriptional accessory protein, partial [Deltaproteobacteria bacterium]|nr:RNA-binding transcriptional accessory protein [Deltaproteobacteria bacterium]
MTQAPATSQALLPASPSIVLPDDELGRRVAEDLSLPRSGVEAVLKLLSEKATVPFIARYRKEATGALDEVQIRAIEERHTYLVELEDRRRTILQTIAGQDKLTDTLRAKILACTSKTALEDLYLPYKPKRRTRAIIAKERGLQALADLILGQEKTGSPSGDAAAFVDQAKGVDDVGAALAGARDIVAETVAEAAEIRAMVRRFVAETGSFTAEPTKAAKEARTKFEQYYDFNEPIRTIPSHRFLALRRGEREKMLRVRVDADATRILPRIESQMKVDAASPWAGGLRDAIADSYQRLLSPAIENDMRLDVKRRADEAAVDVFAENL